MHPILHEIRSCALTLSNFSRQTWTPKTRDWRLCVIKIRDCQREKLKKGGKNMTGPVCFCISCCTTTIYRHFIQPNQQTEQIILIEPFCIFSCVHTHNVGTGKYRSNPRIYSSLLGWNKGIKTAVSKHWINGHIDLAWPLNVARVYIGQ